MKRFTRILFCPKCFENKRPHLGSYYMTMDDSGSNVFKAELTTDHHEFGFTPHLVELKEIVGNISYHQTLCLMDDCGIRINKDEDGKILKYKNNHLVFDVEGEQYYFYKDSVYRVQKTDILKYRAVVVSKPEDHTCTLPNWEALIKLFSVPKL